MRSDAGPPGQETRILRLIGVAILVAALAGCGGRPEPVAATAPAAAPPPPAPAAPKFTGPVLGPDGRCEGHPAGAAAAIEPGIGECDLVRLKGAPPTDVLVGESGKGSREVQVLSATSRPGGSCTSSSTTGSTAS